MQVELHLSEGDALSLNRNNVHHPQELAHTHTDLKVTCNALWEKCLREYGHTATESPAGDSLCGELIIHLDLLK